MDIETTRIWLIAAVLCFAASLFLAKKAEPMTRLSYVPWTAIQFLSLLASIVLAAHFLAETRGAPFVGTRSPLRGL
ncbi:MAG: hypothetical protein AAF862_06465 [Pseudomonadota bacterium]